MSKSFHQLLRAAVESPGAQWLGSGIWCCPVLNENCQPTGQYHHVIKVADMANRFRFDCPCFCDSRKETSDAHHS